MPQYTEDDTAYAIIDVTNSKSIKLAAKEWGIPKSSLQGRIQGSEKHSIAAENQQRLSRVQEYKRITYLIGFSHKRP